MSDRKATLETWLSTAMDMEEKGKAFYDRVAAKTENPLGQKVFKMLGEDEIVHMDRIRAIYESIKKEGKFAVGWREMLPRNPDLGKIFREMAKKRGREVVAGAGDIEALDIGIDFEDKSVTFYKERLESAEGSEEKEFLALMVEEEKSHFEALSDMRHYFTNPESWFREREKTHLDGA